MTPPSAHSSVKHASVLLRDHVQIDDLAVRVLAEELAKEPALVKASARGMMFPVKFENVEAEVPTTCTVTCIWVCEFDCPCMVHRGWRGQGRGRGKGRGERGAPLASRRDVISFVPHQAWKR